MSQLLPIEAYDNFRSVKDFPETDITLPLIHEVQCFDEREELEPLLRAILADGAQTPHGPAEIVDIFTHRLTANGETGMAAFILKGKSFPTVKPVHVSHQIYRLKKIEALKFAIFATPGTILDGAKEQFCTTCEEINCDYSIFNAEDLARIFVAYGFLCPRDAKRISAGRCKCGYSPTKRILNLLQKEALQGLAEAHSEGQRTGLIVLPPGTGKTRIAAEDAKTLNAKRILYVAHTHEILDVAQSEFEAKFGAENVTRLESSASLQWLNRVNIGTISLLAKNLRKVSSELFDYVIIDEFHHAAARSYRRLIDKLRPEFLLGLTATPFRGDKQNILQLCDNLIVISHELRFGIETGVLCPYHYFGCFDTVDYSQINHNGFFYTVRDLERALIIKERDQAIIEKWREKAEKKTTLAFCCSIDHAKRVALSFKSEQISSSVYSSEMDRAHRQRILGEFKAGKIKILCVIDVLNEGADLPFVECLLFLRPTESKRIFYQQLGRGLRKSPGKPHCIVIDFIGNFKNAYRVFQYQDLCDSTEDEQSQAEITERIRKEVLHAPIGCKVDFDEKVIELFYSQTHDPAFAMNHNIRQILIYQYQRLRKRLGRTPTKMDLDRNCVVNSPIYALAFGSWMKFESFMQSKNNSTA